jgi:type I restriction enzyme, R subunit
MDNEEPKSEIVLYQTEDGRTRIQCRFQNETMWLTQALPPVTREQRATIARPAISAHFNQKQQAFLEFVLAHHITEGVGELDREKLTPLLRLKYHNSLPDALADLGKLDEIGQVFSGFQRYLYQQQGVA